MAGPRVRTDVVDVYVVRPGGGGWQLLQLRRTREPLRGSWQPVMGHLHEGEAAVRGAVREVFEETGLDVRDAAVCRGFWALEQVHPFYIAALDCIVLSARFAALAAEGWEPTLNAEHDGARWVAAASAREHFTWPGQHAAVAELVGLLAPGAISAELLRVPRELLG